MRITKRIIIKLKIYTILDNNSPGKNILFVDLILS